MTSEARAGDDDRTRVVRQLEQAMVQGRTTIDEMEQRMGLAYRARTWDDLDRLTRDLPTETLVEPPVTTAAGEWHVGLLGDVRRGGWIATGRRIKAVTLLGDVVLDLSSASIPSEGVEVIGANLLGDVRVIVPDGAAVEVRGFNLMGDRTQHVVAPRAEGPVIVVRAFTLLGDLKLYSQSLVPDGPLRRWWLALRRPDQER